MAFPNNSLSDPTVPGTYLYPDGQTRTLNEDYEMGPIGLLDTSEGNNNQSWHLTFSGGEFTLTPETTGAPFNLLTGIDSIQCSFSWDQNANVTIAWEDSSNQGYLYWYDSFVGTYVTTELAFPIAGLAVCLDDKRAMQIAIGTSDVLAFYTLPKLELLDQYILYYRRQRDRFGIEYTLQDPAWPYIHKLGMHDALRVQISLSTGAPVPSVTYNVTSGANNVINGIDNVVYTTIPF